jgi:hypothetical protein
MATNASSRDFLVWSSMGDGDEPVAGAYGVRTEQVKRLKTKRIDRCSGQTSNIDTITFPLVHASTPPDPNI